MSDKEETRNQQLQEVQGMIDYIAGGFVRGRETSSVRKRHLQAIMNMESNPPRPPKTPNQVILLSDLDFKGADQNLHDLVVISVVVGNYIIRKVLVNQGSLANILYASTLQKMQIPESSLSLYYGDLAGFSKEWVNILGVVELRTTFGTKPNIKTIDVRYLVIDSRASYRMILVRHSLSTLGAVVLTS